MFDVRLEGELTCTSAQGNVTVTALDERIVVSSTRWRALWAFGKLMVQVNRSLGQTSFGTSSHFAKRVEVYFGLRKIAELNPHETGRMATWFGWPPVHLHPMSIVAAWLSRS